MPTVQLFINRVGFGSAWSSLQEKEDVRLSSDTLPSSLAFIALAKHFRRGECVITVLLRKIALSTLARIRPNLITLHFCSHQPHPSPAG